MSLLKDIQSLKWLLNNETIDFSKSQPDERIQRLLRKKIDKPIISVGLGTCGTIAGARKTFESIKQYLKERNIDANIQRTGCIGLCNLEPIVEVQLPGRNRLLLKNIYHYHVINVLDDIFNQIIPYEFVFGQFRDNQITEWNDIPYIDTIPFFKFQNRLVLNQCGQINPFSIEEYIARGGYRAFAKAIQRYTSTEICDIVEESGLRGRSGGGFLTGKKWRIALYTNATQKYLICNAEESDPGAFMDRAIIEGDPHRVLEGISIAAYAIGANKAYIYIRSEYEIAIETLEHAIEDSKSKGLLGQNILESGFSLDIEIKKCPGAFVCGEETALISSMEGKRGVPKTKPPYPATQGLLNKPTVVNNVETLANIPDIILKGPQWFASIGTSTSKGTKIFAISGKIANTCLVEVNMGTSLNDIIFKIAGGIKNNRTLKAVFLGGPIGHCLTNTELDILIGFDELKQAGVSMGSGGMIVLDDEVCIIDMLRYFMHFMQQQSCGKCIPCREGTRRMHEILEKITKKPNLNAQYAPIERLKGIMQLEPLAEVMQNTSLCGLGQSASNPILSALKKFRNEFEEHLYERKCSANVCKELQTFYIKPEACTGCTLCAQKCPVDAIVGSRRIPFYIIEEQCIGCGKCIEACKFNAVYIK